ncbi:MAG: FAD-binding protein [Candidatus Hodarchaeota archaeon]
MKSKEIEEKKVRTEVLIIGSEAAGAKAAIEAKIAGADVLLVTKGLVGRSGSTVMAGRGIQAPIGHQDPRDNPAVFFEDVIRGGAYLNNQKLVERLTELALTEIPKMEQWGAKFVKKGDKFAQYETPGATYARSLIPLGHGGVQWSKTLRSELRRQHVKIIEDCFITSLLFSGGRITGAIGILLREGQLIVIEAKKTILATGGCAQVYRRTDASRDATGDGMALAYHAGAELMDMEFQQFFPLACYTPPLEMSQFTAYLRYFLHGKFYNSRGEAFMERYLPLTKDWDLRDATSRAIYLENKAGRGSPNGGAYIAINHLPKNLIDNWIRIEAPPDLKKVEALGIDIYKDALEVGPACHYSMGGVRVNENCETTLENLYAAGEVAAGMDGAERIDGGPAITWCLTMGYISGRHAAAAAKEGAWEVANEEQIKREKEKIVRLWHKEKGISAYNAKNTLKDIMYEHCGLVKDEQGLKKALHGIEELKTAILPRLWVRDSSKIFNKELVEVLEAINMVELTEMIVNASIMRKETRQAHYRPDYPSRNDGKWLKNIIVKKDNENIVYSKVDPIITKMKV